MYHGQFPWSQVPSGIADPGSHLAGPRLRDHDAAPHRGMDRAREPEGPGPAEDAGERLAGIEQARVPQPPGRGRAVDEVPPVDPDHTRPPRNADAPGAIGVVDHPDAPGGGGGARPRGPLAPRPPPPPGGAAA